MMTPNEKRCQPSLLIPYRCDKREREGVTVITSL